MVLLWVELCTQYGYFTFQLKLVNLLISLLRLKLHPFFLKWLFSSSLSLWQQSSKVNNMQCIQLLRKSHFEPSNQKIENNQSVTSHSITDAKFRWAHSFSTCPCLHVFSKGRFDMKVLLGGYKLLLPDSCWTCWPKRLDTACLSEK